MAKCTLLSYGVQQIKSMANAQRDENNVPTKIGVLSSDGQTPVKLTANPVSHALSVNDNTTGNDNGGDIAAHDGNYVPSLIAVSSADNSTPIAVYVDLDGKLMVDSA